MDSDRYRVIVWWKCIGKSNVWLPKTLNFEPFNRCLFVLRYAVNITANSYKFRSHSTYRKNSYDSAD